MLNFILDNAVIIGPVLVAISGLVLVALKGK